MLPACSALNEQAARSTMPGNAVQLPSAAVEHAARLFPLLNEQAARSTMSDNAIQLTSATVQHAASLCRTCGPLVYAFERAGCTFYNARQCSQLTSAAVQHAASLCRTCGPRVVEHAARLFPL